MIFKGYIRVQVLSLLQHNVYFIATYEKEKKYCI